MTVTMKTSKLSSKKFYNIGPWWSERRRQRSPCGQRYKTFSSPLTFRTNKLECFSRAKLYSLVYNLRVRQKPTRWRQALPANIRLVWKNLSKDKHASLFCPAVCDEEKKVYGLDASSAAPWSTWRRGCCPQPGKPRWPEEKGRLNYNGVFQPGAMS